jgi:hypothetical protein
MLSNIPGWVWPALWAVAMLVIVAFIMGGNNHD